MIHVQDTIEQQKNCKLDWARSGIYFSIITSRRQVSIMAEEGIHLHSGQEI